MSHSLNYENQSSAESSVGFCPPKTFTEFFERYPHAVRKRLRTRWGLRHPELNDWEHNLCVHLMTLPPESVFRERGCADRIDTYDPQKRGGGNEFLFVAYVHLLIDNFCRSQFRRRGQKPGRTILFSDLAAKDVEDGFHDEDEAIARLSSAVWSFVDPVSAIHCQELMQRAARIDSTLPAVLTALAICSSKREAAMRLGITEKVFVRLLRELKQLAHGEQISRRSSGRRGQH